MAKHNEVGKIGEDIARRFIENKGFTVLETNYLKKWGEIDIVAKKDRALHFIEVKTVSRVTEGFKPEDAVDRRKIERMRRVIQSYLSEKDVSQETSQKTLWQFDIIAITLNDEKKEARVRFLENRVI